MIRIAQRRAGFDPMESATMVVDPVTLKRGPADHGRLGFVFEVGLGEFEVHPQATAFHPGSLPPARPYEGIRECVVTDRFAKTASVETHEQDSYAERVPPHGTVATADLFPGPAIPVVDVL